MKTSVTPLPICGARLLLIGLACVAFAAQPALAQDEEVEVVRDRSPDAEDIATTPLGDLNLYKDEIPQLLLDAWEWPYSTEGLVSCDAVAAEIAKFDAVLGPDYDVETPEAGRVSMGRLAQSTVGSLIPFRGLIREISGAASHKRAFTEAIMAGAVRRGFLKGFGHQRGCKYPARPSLVKPVTKKAKDKESEAAGSDTAPDGPTFISEPVVQPID